MHIAVVGSGYVGLVSAACFAELGHEVVCIDNDDEKLAILRNGGVTIHEKGVTPDVEIVMSPAEDESARIQRSREDVVDAAEFKARFNVEPTPDRQLEAAVAVLQSALILESRGEHPASSITASAKQP